MSDQSGFADKVKLRFGVCVLEDEDQLLLRVSSPLTSRSFNTPKFGCSSSQMGFKLCSALLIWLVWKDLWRADTMDCPD